MKKLIFVIFLLSLLTSVFSQGLTILKHPYIQESKHLVHTSPIPKKVYEKRKSEMMEADRVLMNYINKHGLSIAIKELKKAEKGYFKKYFKDYLTYWSINQIDANGNSIIIWHVQSDLVGIELVTEEFMDLTGFKPIKAFMEYFTGAYARVLGDWLWADPTYANGRNCRMTGHSTYFKNNIGKYYIFHNIWKDYEGSLD